MEASSLYKKRIRPNLELITGWARNGLSDAQIFKILGVSETSWYRYLEDSEELVMALRAGREDAEILVENAMFKRATGYKYKEVVRERKRNEETGEFELVVTKTTLKEVAGDVAAQMYWLEHRAPNRWEKNPSVVLDTGGINEAIQSLAQLLKKPVPERKIEQ